MSNFTKHGRSDFMMGAPRIHFDVRRNDEGLFEGYAFQSTTPIPNTAREEESDCIRATREALWDQMKTGI
jgi:hypothetical protein